MLVSHLTLLAIAQALQTSPRMPDPKSIRFNCELRDRSGNLSTVAGVIGERLKKPEAAELRQLARIDSDSSGVLAGTYEVDERLESFSSYQLVNKKTRDEVALNFSAGGPSGSIAVESAWKSSDQPGQFVRVGFCMYENSWQDRVVIK